MSEQKKYRKGQGFAFGFAIGIPLGIPTGLAMGNIAIGPAIGIAVGAGLGMAFEESYKRKSGFEEIPNESRKSKISRAFVISLIAGVAFALLIIYLTARGN
jgi:ABC-type antimicrobial peptide transport system permease subunit